MKLYGLILAGGRSSRFGSDKALATLGGEPLICRIARTLRLSVSALAVSGGRDAAAVVDAPLLADPQGAAQGPLAGIAAGLAWAEAEGADWLVTTTCDVPRIPADMATRLLDAARAQDAALAFVNSSDGPHPLCAVWRPRILPLLRAALADGAHPAVRRFAADMQGVAVPFAEAALFANINTPADLERAEQHLKEQGAHD